MSRLFPKWRRASFVFAATACLFAGACDDPASKPQTPEGLTKFRGHEPSGADLAKMRDAEAAAMKGKSVPAGAMPATAPTPGSYYNRFKNTASPAPK